jgi:phytoene dehydrogenase-like protein
VSADRTVLVVGAGHNGLVAAWYLARAGYRTTVLEARATVGGIATTEEIHPGFHGPTLAHGFGPVPGFLIRDLDLAKHGLALRTPPVRLAALHPERPAILLHEDPKQAAASIRGVSAKDADRFPELVETMKRLGAVLAPVLRATPPDIDRPAVSDLWDLLKVGKGFRALAKKDAYRLLRWGPMAVADLAAEWFESERMRAVVAARGIHGTLSGPWSAGSSLQVLLQAAFDGHALAPATIAIGGPGAFSGALASAATAAGVRIRTGSEVARISVKDGRAAGVVLESGEEIAARAVVSSADPKRTFLRLVDPTDLDPDFLWRIGNYRSVGSVAKVNLALSSLPKFRGVNGTKDALGGRIHIGPDIDYLERAFDAAKYGELSPAPYLDLSIPSVLDPALAPEGAHVVSVHAQFAPYRLRTGDWNGLRGTLYEEVMGTLEAHAPGIRSLVVGRQILTPQDLEDGYGLTGGHFLHGEPTLDQLFTMRPLLGWARYRSPISGLFLCGAGTHPGGGVTGLPGANAGREIVKALRRKDA